MEAYRAVHPAFDEDVRASDYVITMGCGDACPFGGDSGDRLVGFVGHFQFGDEVEQRHHEGLVAEHEHVVPLEGAVLLRKLNRA